MKTTRTAVALALAVIGAPTFGLAQDLSTDTAVSAEPLSIDTLSTQNSRQRGFVFSLRGGAGMKPKYLGSDDYEVTPGPEPEFKRGDTTINGVVDFVDAITQNKTS